MFINKTIYISLPRHRKLKQNFFTKINFYHQDKHYKIYNSQSNLDLLHNTIHEEDVNVNRKLVRISHQVQI